MRPSFFAFALASITLVGAMTPATQTIGATYVTTTCHTTLTSLVTPSFTSAPATQIVFQPATSAIITLPPDEFKLHDPRRKRQECFNDQGFSVNCATWTGYYYTWGPPGNPYEGGPGEGGGGGGSGEPETTIISYAGGAGTVRIFGLAGLVLGLAAFLL